MPTSSYSHQIAFFDFWKELSLRGHKVVVVTPDPQSNEKLTNLTEIDVKWLYKFYADITTLAEKSLTMWNFHRWVHDLSVNISQEILPHRQLQDLIHNKKKHFDVLLVEWFYVELLAFSEIYNCPTILISSLEVFTIFHTEIGNNAHPGLYPDMGSPFVYPLSFKERVTSTILYLYTMVFYDYFSFPLKDKFMRKYFNITSTINELLDNVDMLFLNVNPVLQYVRAIGPTTINTSPGELHIGMAVA
ncbi:UDP-glucuronosyltransferase 2B33-like [Anoplophora glabripennis]|uniref:UDP-glucuronosyltransferase 2B33-like n=1 Tax=Anoplophora glabripennis TaxID=217634 RepID=UPI000C77E9CA|nr:UDP-glucuronosyltransferase 2B33-like [Anoplophora glabripennis]